MTQEKSSCDGCYWNGSCECEQPCEYYMSLDGELSDDDTEMLIESGRKDFRKHFMEYIGECE